MYIYIRIYVLKVRILGPVAYYTSPTVPSIYIVLRCLRPQVHNGTYFGLFGASLNSIFHEPMDLIVRGSLKAVFRTGDHRTMLLNRVQAL